AAADMAMAKFVFRSLVREHPEPSDFLAAANHVVCSEIAHGKFITMVELVADPERNTLVCACAGHPAPRLAQPSGEGPPVAARRLARGVDAEQEYEAVGVPCPPGAAIVVFTDGVIEARRDSELFGLERLDAVLAERQGEPAGEIARAVLEACRAWSGGGL